MKRQENTEEEIHDVTGLLDLWSNGDPDAFDKLVALVYPELRRLARNQLSRERVRDTLQTTALIHETYLRLSKEGAQPWTNRQHFYAIATRAMRQLLIEQARRIAARKRGGHLSRVQLNDVDKATATVAKDVLGVHTALKELSQLAPRQARVVEYRYFGGFTQAEVAELLGVSEATVAREWRTAKLWLAWQLES